MPFSQRIDRAQGVIYTRAWGVLTDEDLSGIHAAMMAEPAYKPDSLDCTIFPKSPMSQSPQGRFSGSRSRPPRRRTRAGP